MTYGRLLMTELRAPLAPPLGPLPTGRTAAPTTRLRSGRHPVTWPLAAPTRDTLRHGTSGGQWLGPRPHHAGNTRAAHTPNRWLKFLHEHRRAAWSNFSCPRRAIELPRNFAQLVAVMHGCSPLGQIQWSNPWSNPLEIVLKVDCGSCTGYVPVPIQKLGFICRSVLVWFSSKFQHHRNSI